MKLYKEFMKILAILAILLTSSCALTGKNLVQTEDFEIYGGAVSGHEWDEVLTFKRASWYLEMTMIFDVLYSELNKDSKFYNWFSTSEKVTLKKCRKSYITLFYAKNSDRVSKQDFLKQAKATGLDQIIVNDFKKAFKLHPQYIANSFQLYDVSVFCRRDNREVPLKIEFPNFRPVTL
jgi:hypothetical protein